ncbi:MAG TPA: serine/threonine-protein kinase [Polyangia bacterium]|nr:serine/threonine-protein kinase [Polyangia bacterium]
MPNAQQLGRYLLLDRIAFGGMAEIFRAKTFDIEGRVHLVAVKRVLNHLTHDDEFMKMLVDEAKITATLSHDNIARVYEFAHSGDEYFIAMEYVDGKDVRALLERHRQRGAPVPPEHVAWIAMEIAHALQAAHTQRDGANKAMHIVHRDVSPSNVLCSYNGEVKLCDFGIAKATLTRTQTKTGVIKGKVKYMSPEQAMGRKLDHRSDLFSLGTVMYEMLTLEPPFSAATEVELIFAVRDARRRSARSVNSHVPEELDQILDKVMSRSRSQRQQSGEELATSLRVFLDRYKPGYRRSHFGRYMRTVFAADIERELRMLEEYVLDGADPTKVGENLIADALPADAPYSKFTAAATGVGAGGDPAELPPLPDLHGQPTRILLADAARSMGGTMLHDRETRMLDMPDSSEPSSDLPSESTDRVPRLDEPTPAPGDEGLPPLAELSTRILHAPQPERAPLHELQTKILRLPDGPPPLPKVVTEEQQQTEPVESGETTTVPLREEDLDPL